MLVRQENEAIENFEMNSNEVNRRIDAVLQEIKKMCSK